MAPTSLSRVAICCALLVLALAGCGSGGGSASSADLASLSCSAGAISPAFDPHTVTYTVGPAGLLSVGSVTMTPTAADPAATLTVDGVVVASGTASPAIDLPIGPTPVMIVVTGAGTASKTYTVVFTRAPPTTQEAYLKASNAEADDRFGDDVALSGDTLVVGAVFEASSAGGVNGDQADNSAFRSGAVYVYTREGAAWSQQAYLKATNTETWDGFGVSVAISGDTIVVGACYEDGSSMGVGGNQADNGATDAGAAYVFTRTGTTWSPQAYLKASNTQAHDVFGSDVSVSGDTIVVSAVSEDSGAAGVDGDQTNDGALGSGAAYVFTRTGTTWSQQAYLKASHPGPDDTFGISVSVSGDTIVVGAYREDSGAGGVDGNAADNSALHAGAAYVFARSGTTWSQEAYLKASNAEAGDQFGRSVSVSGDTIVVSAIEEDSGATGVDGNQADNGALDSGAAYVFTRVGATWSQQAFLKPSNTDAGDYFGRAVAVTRDAIVVGATSESSAAVGLNGNQGDNSALLSGAVYVFTRTGATWSPQAYVKASNTDMGDFFGKSVAAAGDRIAVAAYLEDSSATGVNGDQADDSASSAGAVYVIR